MRYAIGICGLFLAIVTFTVIWIAPASSGGPLEGLRPISKKNLCAVIEHDYKLAVLEHNRTLIKQLADDIVKYRCVTKIPPVTTAKVCSQGIIRKLGISKTSSKPWIFFDARRILPAHGSKSPFLFARQYRTFELDVPQPSQIIRHRAQCRFCPPLHL